MEINLANLKESNDFLNEVFDNVTSAIFIADGNARIFGFNDAFKTLFYKPEDEIIKQLCGNVIGCVFHVREGKDCGQTSKCGECVLRRNVIRSFTDKVPVYKNQLDREFLINGTIVLKNFIFTTKYVIYHEVAMILVIVDDITEMVEQKKLIEKKNQQLQRHNTYLEKIIKQQSKELIVLNKRLVTIAHKEKLLIDEIHHRVRNNLQIIISLLEIKSETITNKQEINDFKEMENRIRTISLLHKKIIGDEMDLRVDIRYYFQSIVNDLYDFTSLVNVNYTIDDVFFNIDTAMPLGLIVNEIVSNIYNHAFSANRGGTITIGLTNSGEGKFVLSINDDGSGFPDDIDPYHSSSLGLQLINALTAQLEGKLTVKNKNGTEFIIEFKHIVLN